MTKTKKIITFSVIGVIAAAVLAAGIYLLCVILAFGNSKAYFDDIVIQNPDKGGTLIIKEWDGGSVCGSDIYYMENGFLKRKKQLGSTSADSAVFPFKNGEYTVIWGENSVTVEYYDGHKQVSKTFELP